MMHRSRRAVVRTLAALLVAPLVACSDSTGPLVGIDDVTYASSLDVDLDAMTRPGSGIAYRDLTVGTGAPVAVGDTVTVSYVGRLPDGQVFDQSSPQRPTIDFGIGVGTNRAIAGFEQGLIGMQAGGTRKIVIPPALAYGRQGALANQVLVFDVQLVSLK